MDREAALSPMSSAPRRAVAIKGPSPRYGIPFLVGRGFIIDVKSRLIPSGRASRPARKRNGAKAILGRAGGDDRSTQMASGVRSPEAPTNVVKF
jgi:hypothetical protein